MRNYRQKIKSDRYNVIPNKPTKDDLQTMIHHIEQKRIDAGRPIVKGDKVRFGKLLCTETGTEIPWYDPQLHTTGDKVKMKDGAFTRIVTL